jgi:chromosome segregation protein
VVALWRTRRAEALEAAEAAEAAARVEAEDVVEALRAAAAEQVRVAEGELATAAADEEAREEVLSAETAVAREALSQAEAASRSARSAAAAAADAARDADLALVRAEGAVEAAAAAGARASDRVAAVVRERDALGAAEDALARDVARLDADKAGVEAAVEQARAARAEASRELHDHDQTVEAARSAAAQAVAATAGLRAGVEAAERAVEAARRRAGELGRAEERERERLAIAEASVGELQRAIGVTEQHLEEVTALVDAARERLSETRERVARQAEAVHSGEAELSARTTEAETARTRATALDADAKETQREVEELRGRIDERYGLSLPGLLDRLEALGAARLDPDPAATEEVRVGDQVVPAVEPMIVRSETLRDQAEIRKVVRDNTRHRKELVALGEVNLLAVDEFRDLTRRYEELIGQREDLEAAVASIRQAIAKMNRTCRQLFRDAFDAVNEEFQRVYPRLVGGGNARLTLTDEEDLLETGVDIFVRPPGKRLQNLTLLSGGEKAMAAIAVILALFRVRPSPFCLLDEVDAPLDEANGARFNEVLVEMSSVSQFIVITHNRKTMECADTLYGVVMSEPGSSRLVSVQLGGAT